MLCLKALVQQLGYKLDPINNIWTSPGCASIATGDAGGDELRIAAIIQQAMDISVLSTELRQQCTDAHLLYHLGSARANIMRPFEPGLSGDILEVGSGCGAITRYLGECGANVLALEGRSGRAAIARARTLDLDNVVVLAEKFERFQCAHQFDVITLIGILENASQCMAGESPAQAMLARALSLLKPSGILIIAIENQLGLKYFAGAAEERFDQSMIGIEGRYRKGQPQTFGRKVLTDMLAQAGFAAQEFFAPFPDYKHPRSILTEQGFSNKNFDAAAFAWQSVKHDLQMPAYCNFSMELAWPAIFDNGLGLDVANSFLISATPDIQPSNVKAILAYHYTVDRLPAYCKETVFALSDNGTVRVNYRRLGAVNKSVGQGNNSLLRFTLPDADDYVIGKPLSLEFIRIVTQDGWSIDQVAGFVCRYLSIIATFAGSAGIQVSMASPYAELPGDFFDVIPQNIIMLGPDSPYSIDNEWHLAKPIEIGHLLLRALFSALNAITRFGLPVSCAGMTRNQFIDNVFNAVGLNLQEQDYDRYLTIEKQVQQSVSGCAASESLNWENDQPLMVLNLSKALTERDAQIDKLNREAVERDRQVIASLRADAELKQVLQSTSWKITKPLRFFRRNVLTKPCLFIRRRNADGAPKA